MRPHRDSLASAAAVWALAAHLVSPAALSAAEAAAPKAEPPKASKPRSGGLGWVGFEEGIREVRKKYVPAAVSYRGPKPSGGAPSEFDAVLRDASVSRALKAFVRIELSAEDLEKAYPGDSADAPVAPKAPKAPPAGGGAEAEKAPAAPAPPAASIGGRLAIFPEKPSLVILSFREEVIQRYEDKLPSRQKLAKDLARIAAKEGAAAAEARRAEKAVEDSKYAAGLGKQREAVLIILPFDGKDAQARLDDVARARVVALTTEYRELAEKRMKEADGLESQRKFFEALLAYDQVMAKFPFKDIHLRCVRRRLEIERKMRHGF